MPRKAAEPTHWRDELALSEMVLHRSRAAQRRRRAADLDRAVAAIARTLPPHRLTRDEMRAVAAAVLDGTTAHDEL